MRRALLLPAKVTPNPHSHSQLHPWEDTAVYVVPEATQTYGHSLQQIPPNRQFCKEQALKAHNFGTSLN